MQRDALLAAGCERVFEEHASGLRTDRPQLSAALEFARPSDQLVIWKLDRLGRGVRQLLDTLDDLNRRGIAVRSLTENIDSTTANGKLALNLCLILSQAEIDGIKERTLAGLQAARDRNRLGGRPRKFTPAKVAMAKALLADRHLTVRQVAAEIGVGVSTLYRGIPEAKSVSSA